MSAEQDPLVGRRLRGTIEILRRIGEGGMGYVYEGYQAQLERRVAIKVMTQEHAQSPDAVKYFLREAKSASRLRHPNIIQIIDFGQEPDGLLYLAMEFVPGRPLSSLIKEDFPLNTNRITTIMIQALSGLEEAHAHEIVHRDLKPDNFMIERTRSGKDFVKILDFGIAHRQNNDSNTPPQESLTAAGALLGTPQYMSPEQACGQRIDARSDLFSMGTILYELLTGQLPFRGENLPKLLMSVVAEEPQAPSARRPELSINPDLEAICLRALAKDKALRYQSAEEFRLVLQEVQSTGNFKPVKKEKPAQFIFKRSRAQAPDADRHSPAAFDETIAPQPTPNLAQLGAASLHTEQGQVPASFAPETPSLDEPSMAAHVIDINDLLSANEGMSANIPKDAPINTPAPSISAPAPAPFTPAPDTASPSQTILRGLADSLRGELVGNSLEVVALVIHQRTARALDAEELAELYELLDHLSFEVAQRWDGIIQSRQGGFITMLFGLPHVRRDDANRAAQAALDLRHRLRASPLEHVSFGMALSTGQVYYPPDRDLSRIAGAPIEQASDAARLANAHEVLALTDKLHDQLSASFKLSARSPQGERAILGLLDLEEQGPPQELTGLLVGREREIASLLAALGRLNRQQGGLLVLAGEGGVGKSALQREALRLATQRQLLILRAKQRFSGEEGLQDVLRQWLRDYLRQVGQPQDRLHIATHELGLGLEYTRILQGFISDRLKETFYAKHTARSIDPDISAGQLIEAAFRQLIKHLSQQQPLLLSLDEIEPYDAPLDRFIGRSADLLRQHPAMMLLAIRTYGNAPPPGAVALPSAATTIEVNRLDERSSFAYLRAAVPDLPDALKSKLVRLSGGNPLQLSELTKLVKANDQRSFDELELALSQSADVRELMRIELGRLPRAHQNILGLLAILGQGVNPQIIADLANPDWKVEDTLQSLYDDNLIIVESPEDPQIFFHSPIFGQVIYQSLPNRAKLRTHERAAKLYQERLSQPSLYATSRRADTTALIRHLEAAQQYELALKLIEELIQSLMQSYEYERAQEFLLHTLELRRRVDPDARAPQLELQLVRVLAARGQSAQALSDIVRLSRQPELPHMLSYEIRLELASLWLQEEDPQLIEDKLKRTVQESRQELHATQNPLVLHINIRAMTTLARVYERLNKLPLAMNMLIEAIELCEKHALKPLENAWGPALIWEPLNDLGRLRLKGNDLEGAKRLFELAREVIQASGDARGEVAVMGNMSALAVAQNDLDAAQQALRRAIKVARSSGQIKPLAKLKHNHGQLLLRQHQPELAEEAFIESDALSQELDWREGLALNSAQLRRLRAAKAHEP